MLLYVVCFSRLGSRASPSIFGLMLMGSVMLSIYSSSCVLYSAGSGVKRVHVVGLRMRLFSFAMFMSLCVDVMVTVMASAYVVSFTGACGVGVSDVYMLKSVGDSTVYAFRPLV